MNLNLTIDTAMNNNVKEKKESLRFVMTILSSAKQFPFSSATLIVGFIKNRRIRVIHITKYIHCYNIPLFSIPKLKFAETYNNPKNN